MSAQTIIKSEAYRIAKELGISLVEATRIAIDNYKRRKVVEEARIRDSAAYEYVTKIEQVEAGKVDEKEISHPYFEL